MFVDGIIFENGSFQAALSDDAVLHVAELLDLVVQEAPLVGKDEQDQLQFLSILVEMLHSLLQFFLH